MQHRKKTFINIFSFILILFGLFGALFSFSGIIVINSHQETIDNIHNISLSVPAASEVIVEMLQNSEKAADNIAESLRSTSNTLSHTAVISFGSGAAFGEIAGMVGFEILGFKPLGEAEQYFSDIGDNLIILSEELDTAQKILDENVSDIELIGGDLASIAEELEHVSELLEKTLDSLSIYRFFSLGKYLLIYLVILNMMFILNGIMFILLAK